MNIPRFGSSLFVADCPEMAKAKGHLFVISGPSGVGKGTILNGLFNEADVSGQLTQVRSLKTRPLRPGEAEARDMMHVSKDEFDRLKTAGELFEYDTFDGHSYGSLKSDVVDKMNQGLGVIFELTADIALKLKQKFGEKVTTVFIAPPEPREQTLRERLIKRGTNDEASIQNRLAKSVEELKLQPLFDRTIESLTGGVPRAIEELKRIIQEKLPWLTSAA